MKTSSVPRAEASLDFCKAAPVEPVVEIASEEKNVYVLWDDSDEKQPAGALLGQIGQWIKTHKDLEDNHRDDLLVCASLTLGNILRHGAKLGHVLGDIILSFEEVLVLTPRCRYDAYMFLDFLHLHGKTYDYKTVYTSISRLFQKTSSIFSSFDTCLQRRPTMGGEPRVFDHEGLGVMRGV